MCTCLCAYGGTCGASVWAEGVMYWQGRTLRRLTVGWVQGAHGCMCLGGEAGEGGGERRGEGVC